MGKLSRMVVSVITAVALCLPMIAHADFPERDIRIIVPWAPGGGVDTTSRIIAEHANRILDRSGVEIEIENRTGGGGIVGQTYAANAEPDGYTVLAMTSSVVTNPRIKNAPYALSDFRPVALYNLDPELIVVPADSEFETIDDFVEAARERSMRVALASPGTSHHMSGLALEHMGEIQLTYLHMDGFSEQVQALIGGHVDAALWPLGEATSHLESGNARALAISTRERMEQYPNLPTWEEAGLEVKEFVTFRGWGVPAGTPDEAVEFLSDLLGQVSDDPEYQADMRERGFPLAYQDASGFGSVVENYSELTTEIIDKFDLAND